MKSAILWCWLIIALRFLPFQATAGFSSLYVFGDSLSAVMGGGKLGLEGSPTNYFNGRFSNGRVWAEYLADLQGIPFDTNKDFASFGQLSGGVSNTIAHHFSAPADAATSLFVVWCISNDCFFNYVFHTNDLAAWTSGINDAMSNTATIIDLLYADGARTLLMPHEVVRRWTLLGRRVVGLWAVPLVMPSGARDFPR